MPPWPEWQFEYIGSRFLGRLLGLWSSLLGFPGQEAISVVEREPQKPPLYPHRRSTVQDRALVRQKTFQSGHLNAVNAGSLANSRSESSLAQRW